MVFGDPSSTGDTLHRILSELHATEADHEFVVAVRAWCATPAPLREPHDFGPRAWNAYLACLRKRGYYFSVNELVTICFLANSNVAVFQQIGALLKYEGGFFDGAGPVTACKLASNRSGAVRSHFERLIASRD